MEIIHTVSQMQQTTLEIKLSGRKIGFVPTMGYLHEGHLSLVNTLRNVCDILVVSIFVNPAQFGPGEDFDKYPRDFERDEELLQECGCDILFYPGREEMYPEDYSTFVEVENLTSGLCGGSRPDHFRGVATIVAKLFSITQCHIAAFGQKDGQQVAVIKRMVNDLNIPVEIVVVPIMRESDGLAMSSRNKYLKGEDRISALCLKKSLDMAGNMVNEGKIETRTIIRNMRKFIQLVDGAEIDYIEAVDPENMKPRGKVAGPTMFALAVKIGGVRLIDNCIVG